MKKIIYVLIFIFLLIMNLNLIKADEISLAKEYYVMSDKLTLNNLKKDGYQLIESNVKFNKVGIYYAIYEKDSTRYNQEIEIIDLSELRKGVALTKEIDNYHLEMDELIHLKKIPNGYLIVGRIDDYYRLWVTKENEIKTIYINKVDLTTIIDSYYDEETNTVYLCGNQIINKIASPFLYYVRLDDLYFLGNVFLNKEASYASSFCFLNNDCYLSVKKNNNQYIYKIDKKELLLDKTIDLNLPGIGIKLIYNDNTFYYLCDYKDKTKQGVHLYQYDLDFNPIANYQNLIDTSFYYSYLENNNIYLIGVRTNYQTSKKNYYLYEIVNHNLNLLDMIIGNQDEELCGLSHNKEFLFLVKDHDSFYLRGFNKEEIFMPLNLDNNSTFFNDDYIYQYEDKHIKCYDFDYLMLKDYKNSLSTVDYDPLVEAHKKDKCLNYQESLLDYDEEVFGYYDLLYQYENDIFKLKLLKTIEVEINKVLFNQTIYNIGFSPNINGRLYVDNKLVDDYKFTTEGTYNLKVVGNKKEMTYQIIIKDLLKDKSRNQISMNIIEPNKNQTSQITTSTKTINNSYDKNYSSSLWYLFIPAATSIIMASVYYIIGRKYQ